MTNDLFTPISRLDTLVDNLGVVFDTLALVLDNLSASATEAEKADDFAKAIFFRNNFSYFTSMLYLLLTQADDMNMQSKAAIEQIWQYRREQEAAK